MKRLLLIAPALSFGLFTLFTAISLLNALLVDLSLEFGETVATIGQLTTISAVSWSFIALLIGPLSDRFGHKKMLVIGLMVFCIALLDFSLSRNFWMLISSSILFGLAGSMAGPNFLACVGDYYPSHIHGRTIAIVTSATPVANLIGAPAAVLIAGSFGWRWSFISLSMVVLLSIPLTLFVLPQNKQHTPISSKNKGAYSHSFTEAFRDKSLLPIILGNTTMQATFWIISTYFAAFLIHTYRIGTVQLAPLLSAMAGGQLAGTLIGGSMADRFNRLRICAIFSVLIGLTGLFFTLFVHNVVFSVLLGGFFMGLYSAGRPAFFSLMVTTSSSVRGTVMGIQATSNHLGRALGAAVGGLVLSIADYSLLGLICLGMGIISFLFYIRTYLVQTSTASGECA